MSAQFAFKKNHSRRHECWWFIKIDSLLQVPSRFKCYNLIFTLTILFWIINCIFSTHFQIFYQLLFLAAITIPYCLFKAIDWRLATIVLMNTTLLGNINLIGHIVLLSLHIVPHFSILYHALRSFTGMVSLYYGYMYRYFSADFGLPDIRIDFSPWQMGSVILTTILSLFGAFFAFYGQTRATLRI